MGKHTAKHSAGYRDEDEAQDQASEGKTTLMDGTGDYGLPASVYAPAGGQVPAQTVARPAEAQVQNQGMPQAQGQAYVQSQAQPEAYQQPSATAPQPAQPAAPGVDATTVRRPYPAQAYAQPVRPVVPAPAQQAPYVGEGYRPSWDTGEGRGKGNHGFAAGLLHLLAVLCRLAAIALALLVVANAFDLGANRIQVVKVTSDVASLVPDALSGALVFQSPLGGTLRGDFVATAVILLIGDWLFMKASRAARRG